MIDTKRYKARLEEELKTIEGELKEIAIKDPNNPRNWEPKETDMGSDHSDPNDVADELESFEENRAILEKLEAQYNDVKLALGKIENGTYGKCEIGGEEISESRLDANPSAKTCIEHSK